MSVPAHAEGGAYAQYGNAMIRSEAAHAAVDNPLSDVVVAVLDTGVAPHPELADALLPGYNFADSGAALDTTDHYGHGTHVAGTVAADAGSGVEGVAYGAKVLPVKVLGDDGSGYSSWVANGIIWRPTRAPTSSTCRWAGPGPPPSRPRPSPTPGRRA